jgi:nucleoside 2-deoxyribosyltransferase
VCLSNSRKKIYLAGGFRSGWQDEVMRRLPEYEFLDPSKHSIQDPKEYTNWDLDAVRRCDIVLGNMERTNPGGYSLALEIGYATAFRKSVLLVDQIDDSKVSRYFEMVRQCANEVFDDLDSAIDYLSRIAGDASCS